jgi:VIT1/CCC1 family predicted Fe2+/Mn2+ transporter
MKQSIKRGFSFGVTSGIITTLGLIIGLGYATESKLVVIAGILTIAIADSFSDSLGIHLSEESQKNSTTRKIWTATISTYISKLFFTLTFLIPFIFVNLNTAIYIVIVYGIIMLGTLSFLIAKERKVKPWKVISEHIIITIIVIILTKIIGNQINNLLLK